MTNFPHIPMQLQDYRLLQHELAVLRSHHRVETSGDFAHYDEGLLARHSARQVRIREIEDLLAGTVVDGEPAGEPVAETGMVVTIRYDDTGETETFLLGRHRAEGADIRIYSMVSPMGCAVADARLGDQRIYAIPHQRGRLVTLLEAVPYAMYAANSRGTQAVLQ